MPLRQACSVCSTGQHFFGCNRKETFACSGLSIDVHSASTKQAHGRKAQSERGINSYAGTRWVA